MKKTLFVVALATMLVFALAANAFAGVDHSGQDRSGAWVDTNNNGVPDPGEGEGPVITGQNTGTFTYQNWNVSPTVGAGTNGVVAGDNSPHGNYTTTTVKCVVCHAVHYAAPGKATVASGLQDADTLLRMKASDACVYCHATAGMAVNGRPVYDGLGGAITGPGATGGNTSTGHIIGTNCSYCHTNVHGANADDSVASLNGYLLKKMTANDVFFPGYDSTNMIEAITAIDNNAVNEGFAAGAALGGTIGDYASTNSATLREQAVGVFCAECHDGAYATVAAGASTNVQSAGTAAFSGHRIAAAATSDWNADGSVSSGLFGGDAVAWAEAANCKSCHDADDSLGNVAFPHSWGGSKMWLTSAAEVGATPGDLPMGGGANAYNTGNPQLSDGVCLKCHVASGGASGVGITF